VQVTDLRATERVHGRTIESLKVSWLIYGDDIDRVGRSFVKRLFDISATATLLVFTLPIMATWRSDCDRERGYHLPAGSNGRGGRKFTLLKFRSMGLDAEKDGRPSWAVANDARVTRVGRFMRRTRIDELPQLINVLRGEMSLVGPRPERPEFVAMLTEQIPFYAVRHSASPVSQDGLRCATRMALP
jgi:lipopolysaccharide/colanic/teichoic acid biosynthesis glycosyltransferase